MSTYKLITYANGVQLINSNDRDALFLRKPGGDWARFCSVDHFESCVIHESVDHKKGAYQDLKASGLSRQQIRVDSSGFKLIAVMSNVTITAAAVVKIAFEVGDF